MGFVNDPFITLNLTETGYDYQNWRKRQFAQNDELFRVYYARDRGTFFGLMTTKTKRTTFAGTFAEVFKLAEQVFSTADVVYLKFVRPTNFPEAKEQRLQKLLSSRESDLNLLKHYLLLLI